MSQPFAFNNFPTVSPAEPTSPIPETPSAVEESPTPAAQAPVQVAPAAEGPAPAGEVAAPAKKTTTRRKSPARKTAPKKTPATDAPITTAIEALLTEVSSVLGTVSPAAAPIEVLRALRQVTSALSEDNLKVLSQQAARAAELDATYSDFIVGTSVLDEGRNGTFDGYSVADGQVELD